MVIAIVTGCAFIAMVAFIWYELKNAIDVDQEGYVLDEDGKRTGEKVC